MFIFKGLASRTSNKFGLFLINVTMPFDAVEPAKNKRDPTMNHRSLRTCGTSSPSGVTPSLWSYPFEYRITRAGNFPNMRDNLFPF